MIKTKERRGKFSSLGVVPLTTLLRTQDLHGNPLLQDELSQETPHPIEILLGLEFTKPHCKLVQLLLGGRFGLSRAQRTRAGNDLTTLRNLSFPSSSMFPSCFVAHHTTTDKIRNFLFKNGDVKLFRLHTAGARVKPVRVKLRQRLCQGLFGLLIKENTGDIFYDRLQRPAAGVRDHRPA